MPAEARVTKIWKQQKLLISLLLIAFGLWFFVDGKWFWPRSNERWVAHNSYEKAGDIAGWKKLAQEKGWKEEPPHKYHDKDDILAQFIFGSLCGLGGAITLIYFLSQKNRVVRTDADAVHSPAGTRVPFESITGLGVKKWESKGYAKIRYTLDGKSGEFLLDDYKFERDPTHAIFEEIKNYLEARPR